MVVFVDRLHILEDSDTKLLIVATETIYEKTKGYVGEPLTTTVVHSHRSINDFGGVYENHAY